MSKRKTKTRSLRECRTLDQLCELTRDSTSFGDFHALFEVHEVHISRQRIGEHPTESISIPRKAFCHFVDTFMRQQKAVKQ